MSAAQAADISVSKTAYASMIGVSAGRVSQFISEGKLTAEALDGQGRSAKIRVAVANRLLKRVLDPAQSAGLNGMATDLGLPLAGETVSPAAASAPPRDPYDDPYRREKLREMQLRNQRSSEEEMARRGTLVSAAETQSAMASVAATMLTVFEGAITDLAQVVAAKHALPHRDLVHLLRGEFRAIRAKAAEAARRRAQSMLGLIIEAAPGGDQPEDAPAEA